MSKRSHKISKQVGMYMHLHELNWLEWVALIVSFWFVVYPYPYQLLLVVLILLPLVGLWLNGLKRPSICSLISISDNEKYKYDVADYIDMPAIAIVIRCFIDYEYEDFFSLVIPGAIALAVTLTLLFYTHNMKLEHQHKDKKFMVVLLFCSLFVYSYGATYAINCTFDTSDTTNYKVKVIDKRATRLQNKGRTSYFYYFRVTPWGHHYDTEEIWVSRKQFGSAGIGDSVTMGLHKGLFNIPWYQLE